MENDASPSPEPSKVGSQRGNGDQLGKQGTVTDRGLATANTAVGRPRRPAATIGRSVLGLVGGVALAMALYFLFQVFVGEGLCADEESWAESISCNAGSWVLIVLSGAIAALALPGAALGIKGRRGAIDLLLNVPFLMLTAAGLGLLIPNLGPLLALLKHEDAINFTLAVIFLAIGLPIAIVLTWRQISYGKVQPGKSTEASDE